ncbi:MAG TPA: nucleoside 2-deoxyribosyltransferase domain-containing protein [Gemmataceae bacterium]
MTARYTEAPQEFDGPGAALFLAGGITGTPDWQREMRRLLSDLDLVLLNPRRASFPIDDPGAAPAQIAWEYRHLRRAAAVLFWFPEESICPIALFELGAMSMTDNPLFVGTHPRYPRRLDVLLQLGLARPAVRVAADLGELADQVRAWWASRPGGGT